MLSLCLIRTADLSTATDEARLAIVYDPQLPLGFYAMAAAMFERSRDDDSRQAIEQAIALDQTNPNFHGLLAQLYLRKKLWRMALNAADRGLSFDPQHSLCLNARANALIQLGEREQAAVTVGDALANDPDDSYLHANRGWALLHERKPRQAMTHFRESLRLDPNNDWARAGVVESLKASFFVYRWLLAYFLWMARLSSRAQNGILIGGFVGYQVLRGIANTQPGLRPFITPLLIAYTIFALLTWLASALLNLLLRLHPIGKHALSWNDRRTSELVGLLLLLAIGFGVSAIWLEPPERWMTLALACFMTSLPTSHIFYCKNGWPRWTMASVAVAVLAAGIFAGIDLRDQSFSTLVVLSIASQFVAMSLVRVRTKR